MCAWADGQIHERERVILSQIIARIDLADEIHSVVHNWMNEPPSESEGFWESLRSNPETAKTALYQVVNMAAADHVFQFRELSMMAHFRGKLNVSLEDFNEIITTIEKLIETSEAALN